MHDHLMAQLAALKALRADEASREAIEQQRALDPGHHHA
jgi:hypothetical protein